MEELIVVDTVPIAEDRMDAEELASVEELDVDEVLVDFEELIEVEELIIIDDDLDAMLLEDSTM